MPYAIIKTGGKQFRVESGRTYKIPSLVGDAGGKIEFNDVLLGNDGTHGEDRRSLAQRCQGDGRNRSPRPR